MGSNIPFSASAQRTLAISAPTPYPYLTYEKSSPQFDPRLIPGCQLWLDAKDIFGNGTVPNNGATISTWYDKSDAGNNFTGVNTPTYSTNAVNLSGYAYLSNATPTDAVNTMFFVYNANNGNIGPLFSAKTSGADVTGFFPNWLDGYMYIPTSDTAWYNAVSPLPFQQVNIISIQYSGGTSAINVLYNSSNIISTTQSGSITRTSFLLGVRVLGSTGYFQGKFYEVLSYNTVLSTTQRQQVEAYLAQKWKVSSLSTQNIYAPGSYLTYVNPPRIPTLPMRRAVQGNKFLPPQYSNCVLWLDATDVNGTGTNPATGTITSWTDKSGAGNSSTASGGTPTLTANLLNGKPGVAFSSASSSYIQVPRVVTSNWSIFIVFSTTQTGPNCTPTPGPGQSHTDSGINHWWAGQGIFDGEVGGTVNDMGISLCGSPTGYLGYGTGNLAANTDTTEFSAVAVNTGAGFIGEFFRTASSGTLEMYVNGTFQVSATGGTADRISPNLKIGSIQTLPAGYFFTGTVYEIVCYTRVLTSIERQQIEGYFAWKWGLKASLGSGHPFFLIPPLPLP